MGRVISTRKQIGRLRPRWLLTPWQKFNRDGYNNLLYGAVPSDFRGRIIVMGGYLGDSAREWARVAPHANIHVFEPITEFVRSLELKLGPTHTIHPYGLAEVEGSREFQVAGASSAELGPRNLSPTRHVGVLFRGIDQFKHLFDGPYVIEINIEGGEYEFLPLLAKRGLLGNCRHLFVQFHNVGPSTQDKVRSARALLDDSLRLRWRYEMVWEHWALS